MLSTFTFCAGGTLQFPKTRTMSESYNIIPRIAVVLLISIAILSLVPASSCSESLQQSQYLNRTRRSSSTPSCYRDTEVIPVHYEGCETAMIPIDVCKGSCGSHSIHSLVKPYKMSTCNCCKGVGYKIKLKKIMFRCGPQRIFEEKKVYYPKLLKRRGKGCGCRECSSRVSWSVFRVCSVRWTCHCSVWGEGGQLFMQV